MILPTLIVATAALVQSATLNIHPAEAAKRIANEDVIVLDVRTPEEFAKSHIPGAKLLNLHDPSFLERAGQLDPNQAYLVQCRSGVRSARAAEILQELGIDTIYNLQGGIIAWENADLPTVTKSEETPQ
ncbi:MAG: rhodanese-like domain-containing protein [Pseudomonadota bacterium]